MTGMPAWVISVALSPLDAKLDKGEQHLVQVLRAHTGELYAAVLLAAFFAVLTRLIPEGSPGWGLLRVSLAGCVITQTMAGWPARRSQERRRRAGRAGLARALADVAGFSGADHLVHGDRGAGAAAGRAVPALGGRPGLAIGAAHHPRPLRCPPQ